MKIKITPKSTFTERCVLLLAAFLMIVFPSTSVIAQEKRLSDDPNFLMSNNIYFYDPNSTACVSPGASYSSRMDLPTLVGNENAEKIWNFLKQDGFSDEQAAGIMGNIRQESNYNPDIEEGNGVGYGLIQWSYTRRDTLEKAAREEGVAVSDLGFQLAYLKQEASSLPLHDWNNLFDNFNVSASDNAWDALKRIDGIDRTTTFFHDSFERSGDYDNHGGIQHRIDFAGQAFESFKGTGGGGQGSSASTQSGGQAGCAPFAGGDLTQTLLAYAHPEFHENNWTMPDPLPKEAYLEAATRLSKEGKWVGGGMAEIGIPGIDCGGFVSILLTESGFEPDYNFGLDLDRGASNQEYGQLPWAKRNWTFLGTGGNINTSDLRPGDVAYTSGHTFVYVGEIEGFASQYASASYDWWRSPMAAGSWDGGFESATNPDYVWYGRREGTPPAYGTTHINDPILPGNGTGPNGV